MSTRSPWFALTLALALAACSAKSDEAKPEADEASKADASAKAVDLDEVELSPESLPPLRKVSPDLQDPFKDGGAAADGAEAAGPRIVLGCAGPDGVTVDGEPVEGTGAELDAAVAKQITARLSEHPDLVGVVSCDGDDAAERTLQLLKLLRANGVEKIGDATARKVNPALEDPFKAKAADPTEPPADGERKVSPDLSDPFAK